MSQTNHRFSQISHPITTVKFGHTFLFLFLANYSDTCSTDEWIVSLQTPAKHYALKQNHIITEEVILMANNLWSTEA